MDASLKDAKRVELNAELRKARGWILAVGIIMFVVDMVMLHAVYGDVATAAEKNRVLLYDSIVLGVFVALWWCAQYKPKLCCILALCAFWGLQLYNASFDATLLYKGIVIKVLFTMALVNGIKSAGRAETLQKELEEVFG